MGCSGASGSSTPSCLRRWCTRVTCRRCWWSYGSNQHRTFIQNLEEIPLELRSFLFLVRTFWCWFRGFWWPRGLWCCRGRTFRFPENANLVPYIQVVAIFVDIWVYFEKLLHTSSLKEIYNAYTGVSFLDLVHLATRTLLSTWMNWRILLRVSLELPVFLDWCTSREESYLSIGRWSCKNSYRAGEQRGGHAKVEFHAAS